MDLSVLGEKLLKAGAPVLKSVIEGALGGGIKGKIAGGVIDALADALGSSIKTPEAIASKIDADPAGSATIIQAVEKQVSDELARIAEANRDVMVGYQQLLLQDAKDTGLLARIWRPLFAIFYIPLFAAQIITACWLMWTRQLGTLTQLDSLVGYLTFMNLAACAVLGVTVWQAGKTERETSK